MNKKTKEYLELLDGTTRNLWFDDWVVDEFRKDVLENEDACLEVSENARFYANKVINHTETGLLEIASFLEDYTQEIINEDIADYQSYCYSIDGVIFDGIYGYLWDLFETLLSELGLDY